MIIRGAADLATTYMYVSSHIYIKTATDRCFAEASTPPFYFQSDLFLSFDLTSTGVRS